ncbi:MAG: hypothetical protein MHM6MM_007774 [Cercozoa sp. M6MM]
MKTRKRRRKAASVDDNDLEDELDDDDNQVELEDSVLVVPATGKFGRLGARVRRLRGSQQRIKREKADREFARLRVHCGGLMDRLEALLNPAAAHEEVPEALLSLIQRMFGCQEPQFPVDYLWPDELEHYKPPDDDESETIEITQRQRRILIEGFVVMRVLVPLLAHPEEGSSNRTVVRRVSKQRAAFKALATTVCRAAQVSRRIPETTVLLNISTKANVNESNDDSNSSKPASEETSSQEHLDFTLLRNLPAVPSALKAHVLSGQELDTRLYALVLQLALRLAQWTHRLLLLTQRGTADVA